MRILYLSKWFPYPPDNGARLRTYYLLKALAERHEVFLISLLQDDSDSHNVGALSEICTVLSVHPSRAFRSTSCRSITGLFSRSPRSVVDTYDSAIKNAVLSAVQRVRPNAMVTSHIDAAVYEPLDLDIPSVLDNHNCEYAVLKRNALNATGMFGRLRRELGWRKYAHWESEVCRRHNAVTVVSDEDRRLLLEVAPDLDNLHVVPNGVDVSRHNPELRQPRAGVILYNGALTYGANLDAVRYYAASIHPILSQRIPGVRLRVTGRYDGVDLSGIKGCAGIELTGYVEDIRTELSSASVCLVPLREGGGTRLKILEAMAAGVPVVATSVGAEGIDVVDHEHILIADAPEDIAQAVATVLCDSVIAATLSCNARRLVETKYDWSAVGRSFVGVVESMPLDGDAQGLSSQKS